jgi:hypothetical protein
MHGLLEPLTAGTREVRSMAITTEHDVDGTILPFPRPPSGSVAGRTLQESGDKAPFALDGTVHLVHVELAGAS